MKLSLKACVVIEWICFTIIQVLSAPFILGYASGKLIVFVFDQVLTARDQVEQLIGNYLMKQSKEFKDGKIQNPYCVRNYTAHLAYDMLKDEGVI